MQRDRRAPYEPYHDLVVTAGSATFVKLFQTEGHFMAQVHSKESRYLRLRRYAVQFIENQSRSHNFDALIPYMAMTYVDRFCKDRKIPKVVKPRKKNEELFLICCLIIAWKLRTKTFELPGFLNKRKLKHSEENVLDMELRICTKLEWRVLTLTPFRFVEFLVPFLTLPPGSTSPVRSVRQLIVKSQFDIAFTEFRPSVLAVSAMLTVSSKMFPAQHGAFETHIITSPLINPEQDNIYRCNRMMAPLYRQPSVPEAREEPAASAERKPAEPKADPGEASSSVVRKQAFEAEKVPAAIEEGWTRRKGKEPLASETHPEITEERYEAVGGDSDKLMNFELGWIEALADADRRGLERHAGFGANLGQRLIACCSLEGGCNIL